MTHTLNRIGLSEERPGEEIVFLCMVHHREKSVKEERMQEVARIAAKYKPDNLIGRVLGLDEQAIMAFSQKVGVVTAAFSSKEDALEMVREIKDKKLGLSVVISALFSDVREICNSIAVNEHTYNVSLGLYGRTELLPDKDTLSITTQCGHHMVSHNLVKHLVTKIRRNKMTSLEAAELVGRPCACGVVNHKRVREILEKMADISN